MPYNAGVSHHPTTFEGSVPEAIQQAIIAALDDAQVHVTGGGGHYSIAVRSARFAGKSMLESHRMVYAAIAHLLRGDEAPVHAVDSLSTRAPD
jgi:acid stress-induced BolA-like protein IbaG/YrbA